MAISDQDLTLALAHYRIMFPDLVSLGTGNPPAVWNAERLRVTAEGMSATLFVGHSYEGGSSSAQKNFDQRAVLQALYDRRSELDSAFDDLVNSPAKTRRAQAGFVVQLGGC